MEQIIFEGVDPAELARVLAAGVDHAGNTIETVTDHDGGWQLRCCLADSVPGDEIAFIAFSPFEWNGPFRETGPIVVHARGCAATWQTERLPEDFDQRPMTLRPYNREHRILYDLVEPVPAAVGLDGRVRTLLQQPDVAEVYGRNPQGGCFAFVARRAG